MSFCIKVILAIVVLCVQVASANSLKSILSRGVYQTTDERYCDQRVTHLRSGEVKVEWLIDKESRCDAGERVFQQTNRAFEIEHKKYQAFEVNDVIIRRCNLNKQSCFDYLFSEDDQFLGQNGDLLVCSLVLKIMRKTAYTYYKQCELIRNEEVVVEGQSWNNAPVWRKK